MNNKIGTFFDWLRTSALPLWSGLGVDRELGGFIEQIDSDGTMIADVRRARLVARQIYAFRTAGDLGWNGPVQDLTRHGLAALIAHHISEDDVAIPNYIPATCSSRFGFDLYDQAFVLFGLANAARLEAKSELESRALRVLRRMRAGWSHPDGGFAEANPLTSLLKANPHMHLLEAALSWSEISENTQWLELAAEIVNLCLRRFISGETGALHEFFVANWCICDNPEIDVVEPGHQSEWAWLLMRWGLATNNLNMVRPVARRLFDIAEQNGCNAEQYRLINELDAELAPKCEKMRLWPQTERIKALILFVENAETDAEREELQRRLVKAISALLDYFKHPIDGSWWEHIEPSRKPLNEPARASSLYHIMGAAAELARFSGERLD